MQTRADFLASAAALSALIPSSPSPAPLPPLPAGFTLPGFDAALTSAARHKHLFACISEADIALRAVRSTKDAYREIGVAAADVQPAVVFYHDTAVLSAFDDAIWRRYVLPAKALPKLADAARDAAVPVFACNLATRGFAARFAKALHLAEPAVYADMAAHLVPNAMLVPAGVWAVHAIQERGYTLLQFA